MPVRAEVMSGVRERGLEFLGFSGERPVLLVMGGSLGAASVNNLVWSVMDELVNVFDVVHVTGAQNTQSAEHYVASRSHYKSIPYLPG